MPSAHDVVAFIRRERGNVGGFKLQKLLYYSQAWSLTWDGEPIFSDPIQAWVDGPAVRSVHGTESHGGGSVGDADALSPLHRATVLEVLRVYARHNGDWLSALTHRERPWIDARGTTPGGVPSKETITHASMKRFYARAKMPPRSLSDEYHRGLRLLVSLPEDEALRLFDHQQSVKGDSVIAWLEGGPSPWLASSG